MSANQALPRLFAVSVCSLCLLVACATSQRNAAAVVDEPIVVLTPSSDPGFVLMPELRSELLEMMARDQDARLAMREPSGAEREALVAALMETDARHTERMKAIVADFGWPTRGMVGDDGAQAAWLLVQHADRDVAFQRECLARMEPLLDTGAVFRANVANLTDRVLVNEGKPQIYATQFHTVDGKSEPQPMIEPGRVDERRAKMGLQPLDEYRELMKT